MYRALGGRVVDGGSEMDVRLDTGAKLRLPNQKEFRLGDRLFVLFDYTRWEVKDILTEYEHATMDKGRQAEPFADTPERLPDEVVLVKLG